MKKIVNGIEMDMSAEESAQVSLEVAAAASETSAFLAAVQVSNDRKASRAAKLAGVDFQGTMCSATAEDMWGLSSIRAWVLSGNNVSFKFDNGNTIVLTSANIAAFEAVWIPFRASFFV